MSRRKIKIVMNIVKQDDECPPCLEVQMDDWAKCPRCLEDRKDDWWVPTSEWHRYVPQKWWGEDLCVSCYLFLVRCRIEAEGQGFY